MKKLILTTLLLSLFVFSGCITVSRYYYNTRYNPTNVDDVEVFSSSKPKKEFIEIGEIVSTTNNVLSLKKRAAELGADAIIIIGSAGTTTFGANNRVYGSNANTITLNPSTTSSYGEKAIAIKYK